jgi:hypothetical protein
VVLTHCAEIRRQLPASIFKWQPNASILFYGTLSLGYWMRTDVWTSGHNHLLLPVWELWESTPLQALPHSSCPKKWCAINLSPNALEIIHSIARHLLIEQQKVVFYSYCLTQKQYKSLFPNHYILMLKRV